MESTMSVNIEESITVSFTKEQLERVIEVQRYIQDNYDDGDVLNDYGLIVVPMTGKKR